MYKNIGGKLKGLARIFCTIGIIFSVLAAAVLLLVGFASGEETVIIVCIIGGVIYAGIGSLMAWLSTITLYAFGQQVEMQEKSAVMLENIYHAMGSCCAPAPQPIIPPAPKFKMPKPELKPEPKPVCPNCGAPVAENSAFCTSCGNKM